MEARLMYNMTTILAVPPHNVHTLLRPWLLQHHANRVRETNGVVWGVGGQEEEAVLVDGDIKWCVRGGGRVHGLQQHGAFVLVKELGRCVDMVVSAGVGAADNHDGEAGRFGRARVVDTVVVYGGLEEVGVLLDPGWVSGLCA